MILLIIYPYRSDTSRSELAELSKQANPDEIDIDDDDDDDDNQGPDGKWQTNQACLSHEMLTFGVLKIYC